jgi:hypothetical protein
MTRYQLAQAGLVVGLSLLAPSARGADRPQPRYTVGLRSGYSWGLAAGSGGGSGPAAIPIWVDLGYRPRSEVMLGAYAEYGIGVEPSHCDCSSDILAFGAQVQYRFSPDETLHPWVGFGLGYQQLDSRSTLANPGGGEDPVSETRRGLDFAVLQAGFDVVAVGPFTSLSLGQDLSCIYREYGTTSGCAKGGLHALWTLGLRVALDL